MAIPIQSKDLNRPDLNKRPAGPASSGNFTNLQRVIGANQGNKLGQAVGGAIGQQAQSTAGQFGQAQNQFQQESEQKRLDTDINKTNRSAVLNQFKYNPQDTTVQGPTDEQVGQFNTFRSGSYTGPKELQNQNILQGQGQNLQNIRGTLRSDAGQGSLLRQYVAQRGPYTGGQQKLDTMFLGNAMRQGQLAPAVRQATQAGAAVEKGLSADQQRVQELTNRAAQFGEDTTKQVGDVRQGITTGLKEKAIQAEKDKAAYIKRIQEGISGTGNLELSDAEMADLGVKEGQGIFGDMGQALETSNIAATTQNVGSAADYAKAQALAKLGGTQEQELTDTGQAGAFYKDQAKFNQQNVDALEQQRRAALNESFGPDLQWYLSSRRNAVTGDEAARARAAEQIASRPTYNYGDNFERADVNIRGFSDQPTYDDNAYKANEQRIAAETQNRVNQRLGAAGYQGVDLNSVYGDTDWSNRDAWYQKYAGSGINDLVSRLTASRKVVKKPTVIP